MSEKSTDADQVPGGLAKPLTHLLGTVPLPEFCCRHPAELRVHRAVRWAARAAAVSPALLTHPEDTPVTDGLIKACPVHLRPFAGGGPYSP